MWDLAAAKSSKGLKIATSENLLVREGSQTSKMQTSYQLPIAQTQNSLPPAVAPFPLIFFGEV